MKWHLLCCQSLMAMQQGGISASAHWHMLGFLLQSSDLRHRGGGEEGCWQFPVSSAPCSEQKVKPFGHLPLIPNTNAQCRSSSIPWHHSGVFQEASGNLPECWVNVSSG